MGSNASRFCPVGVQCVVCIACLAGSGSAFAQDEPDDIPLIEEFRFGVAFTTTFINEDGGFSGVAEYNLFAYAWVGAQVAWNYAGDEISQVWPAGTFRWVAPGSDVADFQAFAAVGSAGHGVNFRLEAGPIWKLKGIDMSLTVGFIHVNSAVDRYPKDLDGYCATFGVFWPEH
ncbi:MAG: hypothetical protein R3E66_04305 [bacterium]